MLKVKFKLVEDLGFDSLDTIDFRMALEERFDIEISDEDADGLVTIGDVVKLVVEKES